MLCFWLIAFGSATHDISADGFYMLALREKEQSFFIGIRSTFYRFAMLAGQGLLVILAGQLEEHFGNIRLAWQIIFGIVTVLFLLFSLYHKIILPKPANDKAAGDSKNLIKEFVETFVLFFKKEKIIIVIAFILFYRFGEAQLAKLAAPFMLDSREVGGLALTTTDVGFIYGTVGLIALMLGGILGGAVASKNGLKYWLFWMLIAINVPDAVYIYLSYVQPESLTIISALVALEQFGYGFGFTAFMLYMIYVSEGERKTAHYAIATGIMALGMMLPGMFSGFVQETLGYKLFFIWVLIATIPSFVISRFIPLNPEFGKK
jgi:PAT family beta-lactamase induction signal transducer AmpG